jgi:hypothetical protein
VCATSDLQGEKEDAHTNVINARSADHKIVCAGVATFFLGSSLLHHGHGDDLFEY